MDYRKDMLFHNIFLSFGPFLYELWEVNGVIMEEGRVHMMPFNRYPFHLYASGTSDTTTRREHW